MPKSKDEMTGADMDAKKILAELAENYWDNYILEDHIKDPKKRSTFVWGALADGSMQDPEAIRLVVDYLDDVRIDPLVNFLNIAVNLEESEHGVPGWNYTMMEIFERLAAEHPEFHRSIPALVEPVQTLAWLKFVAAEIVSELPESAHPVLARAWLGTYNDWFFEPFKAVLEGPEFQKHLRAALSIPGVKIYNVDRIKPFLGELRPDEAVHAAVGLTKTPAMRQMLSILEPQGKAVLEPYCAAVLAHDNPYSVGPLAAVAALLHARQGMTPPDDVIERLAQAGQQYFVEEAELIREALRTAPQAKLREWLPAAIRNSSSNIAPSLISLVQDDALRAELVGLVLERANKDHVEQVANHLGANGDDLASALKANWDDKIGALAGEILVRAMHKLGSADGEFFVAALGHSSKAVVAAAELALSELGEPARAALKGGAKSRKKAVREFCEATLARLESAPAATPTVVVGEAEKNAIIEALNRAADDWQFANELSSRIEAEPLKWATVAAEFALARPNDYRHRGALHTVFKAARGTDVYRVYVATATKGDWGSKYGSREFFDRISGGYQHRELHADFEEVALENLRTPGGPYQAELLELYLELAKNPDAAFLVGLLESPSKVAREGAVKQLHAHGQAKVSEIAERLASKKKDTRKAAADALAGLDAVAVRAEIEAALKVEKSADVLASLEKALQAAGGEVQAATVGENASTAELEKMLEGQPKKKLPKFLDLAKAPTLTWADGTALGEKALEAFVGRLALEGPDHVDEVARAIRPHLDDASANAFSVAIKDQWATSGGKAADKWCIYQQGILADEARMSHFAPRLDEAAASGQHHLAGWYIDVLERHGSKDGRSWVAYWAANAERKSLRQKAWAAVERLASAQNLSVQAFLATVNTYIADDVADRKTPTYGFEHGNLKVDLGGHAGEFQVTSDLGVVVRDASQKILKATPKTAPDAVKTQFANLKKQLKSLASTLQERFEHAMVSGRPWSKAALESTVLNHPILKLYVSGLVFRTDDGLLFRASEGEFLGADWNPATLPDGATIRLAHKLDLSDEEINAWQAHLGEGELTQPFEQLTRPTFAKTDEPTFGGVMPGTLAGRLRRLGWRNDSAEDAGMVYGASRLFAGRGVRARCAHGGFYIGDPSWGSEPITVDGFSFEDLRGEAISRVTIDTIAYSEALYDLTRASASK